MINIDFTIWNPWKSINRKTLYLREERIPYTNKAYSIQVDKDRTFFTIAIRYSIREDHAGLWFEVGLLGYSVFLMLHDTRHWDDARGTWEKEDA